MSKINVLPIEIPDIGFTFEAQEQFATDKGILLEHWVAIPSPIGLKDRGDYRRSGELDVVSENGFIYKKVGEFKGTIVSNSKHNTNTDGGIYDNSTARLVLPKYYQCHINGPDKKEISLLPGDRIYAKNIELKVDNYQRAEYGVKHNDYLQFPAKCVSYLIDSQNIEYIYNVDFTTDQYGNIQWISGNRNPGIDISTGKGRVYSIRYTYLAYWYVSQLINEIRVTNDGVNPVRLPYQCMIQREYVYHNAIRKATENINSTKEQPKSRTQVKPDDSLDPNKYDVKVDMGQFEE
ncbi:MAG TPA: hypothetical protein VI911_11945 [Patescibacteria group bacterium]|nr:hypothetical protein [Patescibacteria group bacterium]